MTHFTHMLMIDILCCKYGLKWHSLLFGNNRKLVKWFVIVHSAIKYWVLSYKRFLHAKNNKSK